MCNLIIEGIRNEWYMTERNAKITHSHQSYTPFGSFTPTSREFSIMLYSFSSFVIKSIFLLFYLFVSENYIKFAAK